MGPMTTKNGTPEGFFNPFDPSHLPPINPDDETPESAQAYADRIYAAKAAFRNGKPAPAPADPRACMTEGAWGAYDVVERLGYVDIVHPIPGWRIERVRPDGTVSDYGPDAVQVGACRDLQRRLAQLLAPSAPAIEHDPRCKCGIRVVRDVYTLLQYAIAQRTSDLGTLAQFGAREPHELVLTRVLAQGTAARKTVGQDPEGCIRASRTELKEVFLPRLTVEGQPIPGSLRRKIRTAYPGVTVRQVPGSLYSFQGAKDVSPPQNWPIALFSVAERARMLYHADAR